MAGGGTRGGMTYVATDEMGMSAIENRLDIHDVHATILHLMGIDHERLTYRFGGPRNAFDGRAWSRNSRFDRLSCLKVEQLSSAAHRQRIRTDRPNHPNVEQLSSALSSAAHPQRIRTDRPITLM